MLFPFTAFFSTVYAVLLYSSLAYSASRLLYTRNFGKDWHPYISFSIVSCYAWLLVLLLKGLLNGVHRWCKVGKYNRYRNSILIGFGLIAVFSLATRFEIGNLEKDRQGFIGFIVSFFAALYCICIHKPSQKCRFTKKSSDAHRFLQLLLLIIHISTVCYEPFWKEGETTYVIIVQTSLCLLFASSTFSMAAIFMGMMKLKKEPEELESVEVVPTSSSRPACHSCSASYSDRRLPRFLTQCGHSICKKCARRQLRKTEENVISCPECEKVTEVNGSASQLPINHALMDVVKEDQEGSDIEK